MTAATSLEESLEPTDDSSWILADDEYDPLRESSRQSRYAISNGFLGVRGGHAINRTAHNAAPPRTYVAGLFDTPDLEQPAPGLVTAPDWLQVYLSSAGQSLLHHPNDGSSHRRALDLRRGALLMECRLSQGTDLVVHMTGLRLVSLADREIGQQLIRLEIERGEVEVTLEASFDGLDLGLVSACVMQDLGVWRTITSGKSIAMAAGASLEVDGQALVPTAMGRFKWSWSWKTRPGQIANFERTVVVRRSDHRGQDAEGSALRDRLAAIRGVGWRSVIAGHEAAWALRWARSDVEIDGDEEAQRAVRFAVYHLNSAPNPADESVSIAARALTGDDYRGHVFWDTEIFLLPFYSLTWPEAARALLMYRFHTLDGARAKAAAMGWRGALYAWESADTGVETTPEHAIGPDRKVVEILNGRQEQHISADVAYAVWQYWQATGDEEFLLDAGAEILLETARFWSSRAQAEPDGRCHIRGVIGPDEYHENIDDNAFTNVMARWNIRQALETVALMRARWPSRWAALSARLSLDDIEMRHWTNVAERIATGLDSATGLFEQFEGFFGLERIDLDKYAGRSVPMDVVLGRDRTRRSQIVKQADVVALLMLLPEEFVGETAAENFRYYEPRCSHGSSLSRAMHAVAVARLGCSDMALEFFRETAAIDLGDTSAAIDGGVHIAALGGVWMAAIMGFAGLSIRNGGIALDPHLPTGWRGLSFGVQWHGRRLRIKINQPARSIQVMLEAGEPMTLLVKGELHELARGTLTVDTSGHPGQPCRVAMSGFGDIWGAA